MNEPTDSRSPIDPSDPNPRIVPGEWASSAVKLAEDEIKVFVASKYGYVLFRRLLEVKRLAAQRENADCRPLSSSKAMEDMLRNQGRIALIDEILGDDRLGTNRPAHAAYSRLIEEEEKQSNRSPLEAR